MRFLLSKNCHEKPPWIELLSSLVGYTLNNPELLLQHSIFKPYSKKEIPKTHSTIDIFLSILLCQKFLKKRSVHRSKVS